jgi:hypothetical protein
VINFISDLQQFSGFLHQQNWKIVESGIKYHNPNINVNIQISGKKQIVYFRIYVGFPHPGLNVSAQTFLVSRDRREK